MRKKKSKIKTGGFVTIKLKQDLHRNGVIMKAGKSVQVSRALAAEIEANENTPAKLD